MSAVLALGVILFNCGALFHFYGLRYLARTIDPDLHPSRCFVFSVQFIILSHLMIAMAFAAAFQVLEDGWQLGSLARNDAMPVLFMDRFYFSLVNYTTLGRGDITPTGHLRILAAMEAFLGFLVITGSGAFLMRVIMGKKLLDTNDRR